MASEDENSKGFKIQDRRRFSAEGDLKPEFSGTDEPAATKPEAPLPGGAPPSASAQAFAQAQAATAEQQAAATQPQQAAAAKGYAAARSAAAGSRPSETGAEAGAEMGEISFAAFLMSLSTEALVHLGEVADPSSGQQQRDLAMAQQLIDILGMLRDKTRGNLDHDEHSLLDAILFDLRMKYVEIARRNG
jgi:Domain of unknown function (DUF1844)